MIELITYSLAAYAITFVVASSSLFEPFRDWFIEKYPKLRIKNNKHYIECRMCFGATATIMVMLSAIDCRTLYTAFISAHWQLVITTICHNEWALTLPVYGLSYFLATQERK